MGRLHPSARLSLKGSAVFPHVLGLCPHTRATGPLERGPAREVSQAACGFPSLPSPRGVALLLSSSDRRRGEGVSPQVMHAPILAPSFPGPGVGASMNTVLMPSRPTEMDTDPGKGTSVPELTGILVCLQWEVERD